MWEYVFISVVGLYYGLFCCLACYSIYKENKEEKTHFYNEIENLEIELS